MGVLGIGMRRTPQAIDVLTAVQSECVVSHDFGVVEIV